MAEPSLRVLHMLDHSVPLFSGYSFRSGSVLETERAWGNTVAAVTSARHNDYGEGADTVREVTYHRTPRPDGALQRWQLRVPVWRETLLTRAMARRLEQVAHVFKPDVIHAHSPVFNGQAAVKVARRLGLPVLYHIRAFWEDDAVVKGKFGDGSFIYRKAQQAETAVAKSVDRLVCICGGLRDEMIRRGVPGERILLAKNGVDIERFRPQAPDVDVVARYGLAGHRVLGFLGSFFEYEGLTDLVDVVARIVKDRRDFRFLMVGAGEIDAVLKQKVDAAGLSDVILLPGRVPHEEVQAHYSVMDVLFYPRRPSRLTRLVTPMKPLEAMSMEKPAIGSDVEGVKELLDDGDQATVFRAGDIDDLERVVREVLDWPEEQLRETGKRARKGMLARRTWATALDPLRDAYRELTTGAAKATS